MLSLSKLQSPPGVKKKRKRVGRGIGSGHGKTSGKGQKGQRARSGGGNHPWFEGGQMPLLRRMPKRGFTNIFRQEYEVVNLSRILAISGEPKINPEVMKKHGLVKGTERIKVLGDGELSAALTVEAHGFSRVAAEKIEKSGGKAIVIK